MLAEITQVPKSHPPIFPVLEVSSKQPSLKGHSGDSTVVRQTDVFVFKSQDSRRVAKDIYSPVSTGRLGYGEEFAHSLCSGPVKNFGAFTPSRTRTATGHVAAEPMAGLCGCLPRCSRCHGRFSAIRRPLVSLVEDGRL